MLYLDGARLSLGAFLPPTQSRAASHFPNACRAFSLPPIHTTCALARVAASSTQLHHPIAAIYGGAKRATDSTLLAKEGYAAYAIMYRGGLVRAGSRDVPPTVSNIDGDMSGRSDKGGRNGRKEENGEYR